MDQIVIAVGQHRSLKFSLKEERQREASKGGKTLNKKSCIHYEVCIKKTYFVLFSMTEPNLVILGLFLGLKMDFKLELFWILGLIKRNRRLKERAVTSPVDGDRLLFQLCTWAAWNPSELAVNAVNLFTDN